MSTGSPCLSQIWRETDNCDMAPVAFQIELCPKPLKPSTLVRNGATEAQLVWCTWPD